MKGIRKDEYTIESEVFNLLEMDVDLFSCDTPLGMVFNEFKRLSKMEKDLFTYELPVIEDFYFPCVKQHLDNLENSDLDVYECKVCYDECEKIYDEAVIFTNRRLVRLIDVTVEQWIDLIYGDHEMMDKKSRMEVHGLDADMKYDPLNVNFAKWLALNFNNHKTMDWYTKNALWIYWIRGDDEEVLIDEEQSDLKKEI
nr:hypothetical protein [Tanacetum cinerariifolium]